MKFWKQVTDRMAMICLDLEKLPQVTIGLELPKGSPHGIPQSWLRMGEYAM